MMKLKFQIISLLFIFCLTTSLQCEKYECKSSEHRLDSSKSWLPLKGKTQLCFLDEVGNVANFNIQVTDTVEINVNPDCGATNIYERIDVVLFLTPTNSNDLIVFRLIPPNSFIANAYSTNFPFFSVKDVFKSVSEGKVAKKLSNYLVGTKRYPEVILLFQNPKTTNPIDSIIIANNVGLVGFNNFGKKYTLQ